MALALNAVPGPDMGTEAAGGHIGADAGGSGGPRKCFYIFVKTYVATLPASASAHGKYA